MYKSLYLVFTCVLLACGRNEKDHELTFRPKISKKLKDKTVPSIQICETDSIYIRSGLVELKKMIPEIFTDLRYSSANNFMQRDMYGCLEKVYAHPVLADKLSRAFTLLKKDYPDFSFLVYDVVRPKSVQQKMWDEFDMPAGKKGKFLSNPSYGSLHNYGMAVDITLCDSKGRELDMGTPYDDTARLAYPELESYFFSRGELSKVQIQNRQLLRKVMYQAGFFGIQTEWWHFNACTRDYAKANYKLIE